MQQKLVENIKVDLPKENIKRVLVFALYLATGFVLSFSELYELKPFAVSLVAVSKKRGYIFSALGASVGYFIFGLNERSAGYFCAVVIVGVVAFFSELLELNHIMYIPLISSGVAVLLTDFFVNFKTEALGSEYLLSLGEAVLTVGITYFYFRSINANFRNIRLKALPENEIVYILISASTLLLTIGKISIGYVFPFRLIGIATVLFCVCYERERLALALSLLLGFVVCENNGFAVSCALVLGCFIATLLSSYNTIGISLGYILSVSVFSIFISGFDGLSLFFDGLFGTMIFLLMPTKICDKIKNALASSKPKTNDATLRQSLVLKLRFASSAMAAISDSVDQVRERINDIERKNNLLMRESLSDEEYLTKEIVLEKTNQIRMVASEQFFSISDMLKDLADEFSEAEISDSVAEERITLFLVENDCVPNSVCVVVDKYGRMRVEILLEPNDKRIDYNAFQNEIGKICSRYFDKIIVSSFSNDIMLSLNERPNFCIDIGFAQHSACGELCGDTVKIINDHKGHTSLIISDGMGKGSRAALDGAMGAGLISKLLNAGFGFDSALKVVNCALLVKSNDESLATLDIANIDLFTGKCELFKAGAPCSYIIKGESINRCELSSMPAGILRGIEFAKRTAVLGVNDSIVLMSDGITDLGESWLKDILSDLPEEAQSCADYILARAIDSTNEEKQDDMSVIFATLKRN